MISLSKQTLATQFIRSISSVSCLLGRNIMTTAAPKAEAEKPWHAAYPAPKITAGTVTREVVLSWIQEGKIPSKDFVLLDLRRTDFEVHELGNYIFVWCV